MHIFLGVNPEERDVGSGRTALAAVASEPATVDAVFPAPARSRSVSIAPRRTPAGLSVLTHFLL